SMLSRASGRGAGTVRARGRARRRPRLRPGGASIGDRRVPSTTADLLAPGIMGTPHPTTLLPPHREFDREDGTRVTTDNIGGTGVAPGSLRFRVFDEYHRVQPSGRIRRLFPFQWNGQTAYAFAFSVFLKAKRPGWDKDGRQYVIVVNDRDFAGNVGQGAALVTVPHDMGNHNGAPGSPFNGGGG